jgi:hypothetical protein
MALEAWKLDIGPIQSAKMMERVRMRLSEGCARRGACSIAYLVSRPNTFAYVTGTIKTFGSKKYINASRIRPVRDAHEPFHHLLQAMTVQLFFERGPVWIFS